MFFSGLWMVFLLNMCWCLFRVRLISVFLLVRLFWLQKCLLLQQILDISIWLNYFLRIVGIENQQIGKLRISRLVYSSLFSLVWMLVVRFWCLMFLCCFRVYIRQLGLVCLVKLVVLVIGFQFIVQRFEICIVWFWFVRVLYVWLQSVWVKDCGLLWVWMISMFIVVFELW